ncbi:hypothetical protein FOA52_002397 [Chlamydomonas sp. UWO 241]|nr:hypothetical protein FOA52_002397 [Chlamydomonas sp. UWO 241]
MQHTAMQTRTSVSCGAFAGRRGGGGGGRGGGRGRQQQVEQEQEEEEQQDDERGWWERPEEVSMSRYAVEPLEASQEEALEVAYATYGRRKMKIQELAAELGLDRVRVIAWIKEFQAKGTPRERDARLAQHRAETEAARIRMERQAAADEAVKFQPEVVPEKGEGFIPYFTRKEMGLLAGRKRLPAEVVRTLESIYSRSPFPSDDVIRGVWELHRLQRDVVLEWLGKRREVDGIVSSSQKRREKVRGGSATVPFLEGPDDDDADAPNPATGAGPSGSAGADLLMGLMNKRGPAPAGERAPGGGGGGGGEAPTRQVVSMSKYEMAAMRSALPSRRKHVGQKMEERLGIRADADDANALQVGDVKYVEDASGAQAAKWAGAWRFQNAAGAGAGRGAGRGVRLGGRGSASGGRGDAGAERREEAGAERGMRSAGRGEGGWESLGGSTQRRTTSTDAAAGRPLPDHAGVSHGDDSDSELEEGEIRAEAHVPGGLQESRHPAPRSSSQDMVASRPRGHSGAGYHRVMDPRLLTSRLKRCTNGDELLALVEEHSHSFDHIHVACALHTSARLSARACVPTKLITQLVHVARQHLQEMQPQELANTAWALATLGHVDAFFMGALVQEAGRQLRSFNPQELANTAWALATLGHMDAVFMGALVKASTLQLHNFNTQNLANTAWALATLGHMDAVLMGALVHAATLQLRSFNPQALANTAWALATLSHVDAVFMGALVKAATLQLRNFNTQNLANTVWALATLGHVDAVFMGALVQEARRQLRSFNPQDVANTAWALATLGHVDAVFMGALAKAATLQLRSFNPQNLANTAWALAALDERGAACVGTLIEHATASAVDFTPPQLGQLFQFFLWLDTWRERTAVSPRLMAACKRAWLEEVGNTTVSRTQLQVLDVIRQLPGCSGAISEHLTDDGLFSIDIAVLLPGGKLLAVEMDGPTHFLSNAPTVPNGSTRLRNRLLEARGWRVVSVPVAKWSRQVVKGGQAARNYLTSLGACG